MKNKRILSSIEQTKSFARDLAKSLWAPKVLAITGELGSGKTLLCSEVIKYFCGQSINVTSPTFNIVQLYDVKDLGFTIYHFDLYRIKLIDELYEIGIEEAIDFGLCLIEWPLIAANILPEDTIRLHIEILSPESRSAIIS